ncbi:coiled-coil domain-containing 94 [Brachionus plicatilis]|uniref:Splicing factor YJU2 n=1 Tax=Brachionus plicatilis TaxID=10195 RepID=A0A3M7RRB5_BRAPC|nr:coiled-coil domain-containing 94 [Brachionus plicatilis]
MSERKVLNKYYPPNFDPSKLPRVKREKNRQFTIRLMAPFNMRCTTCGEYIYRGKKFNARKEDVIGKTYLGIQVYRFYIKCTKCLAEITFLTDPENSDYQMEFGAIRNFECIRLAEKQAELEAKQEKEEEANNPMKILENRTRDSRREMAILETLEDIRELNAAHASVDPKILLQEHQELKKKMLEMQEQEDEEEIRRIFRNKNSEEVSDDQQVELEESKREKIKLEENEEEISSKRIKTDESKNSALSEFLKNPLINQSSNNALTKSKISSFIKKKPDTVPNEGKDQVKPSLGALSSLAEYSSDEDE